METNNNFPNDVLIVIYPGWHSSAWQYLLADDYESVAGFYEDLLEKEPDVVEHYWYLGLAYLLLGQEEQAQLTWFVVLGQCNENELEEKNNALTKILSAEGDRQNANQNYQISWLIRGHIRELNPGDYNNLIQFICLDILCADSAIEQLQGWNFTQLLPSMTIEEIKFEILDYALSVISCFPTEDTLFFIDYCLQSSSKIGSLINTVLSAIQPLIDQRTSPKYVVKVLTILLKFEPNNLSFLNTIYILYSDFKDIDAAINIVKKSLDRSQTLTEKLFSAYQILNSLLNSSNWQEGEKFAKQYLSILNDFYDKKIDTKYIFIQNAFIVVNQPLLYLQDQPKLTRKLVNYTSQVFQNFFSKNTIDLSISSSHDLTTKRPIKVGYIGHTLKSHPVGYLSRWLIHHNNLDNVKNYGYMFSKSKDEFANEWFAKKMIDYTLFSSDIQSVIQKIKDDQIDILVDLDSFTYDLTCQVMALKPAPIQVTWLGFDASGIPNIDYFIADPYVLPNDADQYYSEKIWRLPNCYLGIDGFEVGVPTLKREDLHIPPDAVIYANYQNALKRHPHILSLQMQILKAVPNSYLLVKGTGKATAIQEQFEATAEKVGVSLDRLRFLEPCTTEIEHRANLGIVDVFFDTYPYNGATTTLEVLWSEIPLVTRVGEQFAARNSYTFMVNAGITEGIAWTDEEYVEWGIKLGTDENLRKEISWKLKQSKKTSPLWNGKQFARDMEDAYRQMWEIYVKENT